MFAHKFNELKTLMLDHLQTSGNITCKQLASALGISIQNAQISILRLRRQSLVTKESLPRGGMVGRKNTLTPLMGVEKIGSNGYMNRRRIEGKIKHEL